MKILPKPIPFAIFLIIFAVQLCDASKRLFIFAGRITPHAQPLVRDGIKTKELAQITWIVEITNCIGCDKLGPTVPSAIARSGIFIIPLLGMAEGIRKLDVKIWSLDDIPMKLKGEKGERRREFTWKLRNPNFGIVNHFKFGHFRRSENKDEGIYLKMEFTRKLPMVTGGKPENPKNFIKYLIRVKRERHTFNRILNNRMEQIFERELSGEEIQANGPFRLELVKKAARGKNHWTELEPRLLNPRPMEIAVEKIPVCGLCDGKVKDTIFKLHKCNDYVHESCIQKHIAENSTRRGQPSTNGGEAGGGGEGEQAAGEGEQTADEQRQLSAEYKCPICGVEMEVKKANPANPKEKDKVKLDSRQKIQLDEKFIEAFLKMPILQNGDDPEFTYKFDFEDKTGNAEKDYHNAVCTLERKEDSQMIEELIAIWRGEWPQPRQSQQQPPPQHPQQQPPPMPEENVPALRRKPRTRVQVPPPLPSVVSRGDGSSSHVDLKMKAKVNDNPPPAEAENLKDSGKGIEGQKVHLETKTREIKVADSAGQSEKLLAASTAAAWNIESKTKQNIPMETMESKTKQIQPEPNIPAKKEIQPEMKKEKAENEASSEELEFFLVLNTMISIASTGKSDEEKMEEIEKAYEKWEVERGKPSTLNELIGQIIQIQELDLKKWKEAVKKDAGKLIVEMQPKIVEMVELRWIRAQRNLENAKAADWSKTVETRLKQGEAREMLLEGIDAKCADAYENFVFIFEEADGNKEAEANLVRTWAKYMDLEDLFEQIVKTDNAERAATGGTHNNAQLSSRLKAVLKEAALEKIREKRRLKSVDEETRKKLIDKLQFSEMDNLPKTELREFLIEIEVAAQKPENREKCREAIGEHHNPFNLKEFLRQSFEEADKIKKEAEMEGGMRK